MFESINTIRNPAIKLYALIGYCVSTAAEIEHELFECFRIAKGISVAEASAIFFKAPSHEYRLRVSDDALQQFASAAQLVEWTRLHGHLGEQLGPAGARNLVAHNPARGGVYVSHPETTLDRLGENEPVVMVMMEVSQHYGLVELGRRKENTETIESLSSYANLLTHLNAQLSDFRQSLNRSS